MFIKTTLLQFLNENKYWSNSNINQYKKFIKYQYSNYFKETGLTPIPLYKINIVGSFGTDKFIAGKSDIDFMLDILGKIDKSDMISIINYLNDKLIIEYGEIDGKLGKVEVIGINGEFWFE